MLVYISMFVAQELPVLGEFATDGPLSKILCWPSSLR
jgi:hypothetical protein